MKSRCLTLLFLMIFMGCKDNEFENREMTEGIRVYTHSAISRTSFQDNDTVTHVKWNADDCILISSGKQKNLLYRALESRSGTTEFIPDSQELSVSEGETVYATYTGLNFIFDNSLPDSIIEVQRWQPLVDRDEATADVLYAVGKVESGKVNLQFKHLFTFLKVILPKSTMGNTTDVKLRSTSPVDYEEMLFDVKNEQIVGGKPLESTMTLDISNVESDEANLYLYFAILPQPENAALTLWNYSSQEDRERFFFSRKTPKGGMKAGCMYVMDINSDKIQQEGQREREALAEFFRTTNGSAWKNQTNWCSDSPLNDWYGIKGLANVVQLDLIDNQLEGTLPESFAILLDNADLIDLRKNCLHGEIPEAVRMHPRWNDLGWNIIIDQHPFGFDHCGNYTNVSPRSGFDFSKGGINLSLHDMEVTLMDGSQERLMNIIGRNKLTQILTHSGGFFDSPWHISDQRVNLHLDYQNGGLGTVVQIGYYWGEPIGEEWKEFAAGLPARNFVFIDEKENLGSIIPISRHSWLSHAVGDVFLVNSQGELVDHFPYIIGDDKLEEWYCHKIDSVVRIYCGNPEEHPDYSRQLYTSTDYSRDGESSLLQKASIGKGIDLVFMGEAFVDRDMGDGGKYEQKMKEAMEQFFAFEPYKTFRDRFNVYAVKVVSPNAEFTSNARHRINESYEACLEYVEKISGRNPEQEAMVSVIYNVEDNNAAGRSYTVMGTGFFVAYMMEGVNTVLNHEAGGHGFAKLLDEYVEEGNENQTLPAECQEELDFLWDSWGWGANVDWRNDVAAIKWAHFLQDDRYRDEVGIHEGAYLYGFGAYRPTENSMMRYNDSPFNAPGREQIYKTIMRMSEGEEWVYDYEEFVKYDSVNLNGTVARSLQREPSERQKERWRRQHRKPVFVKDTLHGVLQGKKRSVVVPLR